jgi:hypothetical protein
MEHVHCTTTIREPWNKGKLVGQKAPFKLKEIWAIRVRLQRANRRRELALFNLAIDPRRSASTGADRPAAVTQPRLSVFYKAALRDPSITSVRQVHLAQERAITRVSFEVPQ